MIRRVTGRYAIVFAAWLPFFAVCVLFAMLYARSTFAAAMLTGVITIGSASLLGIAVWHVCQRHPWPLRFELRFYLLQLLFAATYSAAWTLIVYTLATLRGSANFEHASDIGMQMLMGIWLYLLFAGLSYVVQTRNRLREKEALAAHAQAQTAAARLDAIRARLNPHFLFNALHTLGALVKFRPTIADGAIERLGDMLRYTLKEDGRELVEFAEEYEFTRQYLAFEQLRYEGRLAVELQIDPESFHFDIPPFSIQILAENAVHHAISVRPEGGSIWITSTCRGDRLTVTVRDDGPGGAAESGRSHQFGLRSLRERLHAAYGPSAELELRRGAGGCDASFAVSSSSQRSPLAPT